MAANGRRSLTFSKLGLAGDAQSAAVIAEPATLNAANAGAPNRVRTTRFTLASWLPKSLFAQFQRAANIYFVIVCGLVLIPDGPLMWQSTVGPFCLVLFWTALKDLYEDRRRQRDDDAENLRSCTRYNAKTGMFEEASWQDVKVGDVLLNFTDEAFPADVLVIRGANGQAFISTVNLDGETNLKERRPADAFSALTDMPEAGAEVPRGAAAKEAVKRMAIQTVQHLFTQGVKVDLEMPMPILNEMDGTVDLKTATEGAKAKLEALSVKTPETLNAKLFIPRGCVLRNSLYCLSVAAYCGNDTKTRLNVADAVGKVSNMQLYLNRGVQALVSSLAIFCLYAAIAATAKGVDDGTSFPMRFIFYWIILYQVVPISLYVCFEIVKLVLGFQINKDPAMVDPRTGVGAMARTADLVEEMGQVNFVFSDKTGTLTENEMVYARACVAGTDLGDFRPEAGDNTKEPAGWTESKRILSNSKDPLYEQALWFFLSLATNHSVQVEVDDQGKKKFEGSSADEVAFVQAAADVGVTFTSRVRQAGSDHVDIVVTGPGSEERVFTKLGEIPFTSERKRMSVIFKHAGDYWIFCKGADNIMGPLLDEALPSSMAEKLTEYSKLGLRTLVVATRKLDERLATKWLNTLAAVGQAKQGKEEALAEAAAEIEHSLNVAGVTAIEDKLQQGVPEAIVSIKAAGIRFWVLTGDKTETAVEIVKACRLFTESMVLAHLVNCKDEAQALQLLQEAKKSLSGPREAGLVIDGSFVQHVLSSDQARLILYDLAMASRSCVCCRLSPQQKRKLVELVKEQNKAGITLAIGDGANDVSMIQGAHVGIGIRGKEGNQAVQASDVAISQFRFLVPLLLCHGRRAYRRVATFLCYMFYKHTAIAIGDIVWAHQVWFAGVIAYPDWLQAAFPAVVVGLPVLVVMTMDKDLPDEIALLNPELYVEGLEKMRFNPALFASWIFSAVYHGTVAWLVPNLMCGSTDYESTDFWYASVISFISVVVFVNCRLWMVTESPGSKWTIGIMAFSFFSLFFTIYMLGETTLGYAFQPEIWGVVGGILGDTNRILALVCTPMLLLVDLAVYQFQSSTNPYPLTAARRRLRKGQNRPPEQKLQARIPDTTE
mmetsp:Transcript_89579/g.159036  ORF Transcript_89579/g.159036 Transcript_89579/m.159036 type:complete len:1113 (+) Transcript_89579:84-3422(+)